MTKFATKAVHAGVIKDKTAGAITTPLYQTSTYVQEDPGSQQQYAYARGQNPSRQSLEQGIAELENGKFGLCFSSGMAASDAIFRLLKPGEEVLTTTDIYGGSYRLFANILAPLGIKFRYISFSDPNNVTEAISSNTKMIWLETPTNPMLTIFDIRSIAEKINDSDIKLVVDNTFATPYLQQPLELGAHIVMHSVTKYLAGHSDLIMGAAIVRDEDLYNQLKFIQNTCGAIPGPNDCFLAQRGMKTLHLRMRQNCHNASKIAQWLSDHPMVSKVNYPGLLEHPGHEIAAAQMKNFGAMISFDLKNDSADDAIEILRKVKVFTVAESLGGVESLMGHPATMSHGSVSREDRYAVGISDSLIRLSVGIEDPEDLVADLEGALS